MAFFAQEAPLGCVRGFAIDSDEALTFMVNASHLPSGDHERLEGDSSNCEINAVSPLSTQRT